VQKVEKQSAKCKLYPRSTPCFHAFAIIAKKKSTAAPSYYKTRYKAQLILRRKAKQNKGQLRNKDSTKKNVSE